MEQASVEAHIRACADEALALFDKGELSRATERFLVGMNTNSSTAYLYRYYGRYFHYLRNEGYKGRAQFEAAMLGILSQPKPGQAVRG